MKFRCHEQFKLHFSWLEICYLSEDLRWKCTEKCEIDLRYFMFDDILLQQKDGATSNLKYVKILGWHWTSIVSKQKQKIQTASLLPKE